MAFYESTYQMKSDNGELYELAKQTHGFRSPQSWLYMGLLALIFGIVWFDPGSLSLDARVSIHWFVFKVTICWVSDSLGRTRKFAEKASEHIDKLQEEINFLHIKIQPLQ